MKAITISFIDLNDNSPVTNPETASENEITIGRSIKIVIVNTNGDGLILVIPHNAPTLVSTIIMVLTIAVIGFEIAFVVL